MKMLKEEEERKKWHNAKTQNKNANKIKLN